MGLKKELLYRLMERGRRDPRWLKRVAILTAAGGMTLLAGLVLLIYLLAGLGKGLLSAQPDLLALGQRAGEKALLPGAEQQQRLAPIVKELAVPGLAPERVAALKGELLKVIPPEQAARLQALKATAVPALPPAVAALIENLTGFSPALLTARIESFLAWWRGGEVRGGK